MVMNSLATRPIAFPLVVTLGLMVVLLPLAVWHQGRMGLWVVVGSGVVVLIVVLLTAIAQAYFSNFSSHPLKQLALVGGLRMGLSLLIVLSVCLVFREFARAELLLYTIPFYLGLLVSESIVTARQARLTPRP
jgi:hypothetical protein